MSSYFLMVFNSWLCSFYPIPLSTKLWAMTFVITNMFWHLQIPNSIYPTHWPPLPVLRVSHFWYLYYYNISTAPSHRISGMFYLFTSPMPPHPSFFNLNLMANHNNNFTYIFTTLFPPLLCHGALQNHSPG